MKKLLSVLFLLLAQFAFGATAVLVDSTTTNVIQPATSLKIPSGMTFTANSGSTVNFAAATSVLGTPTSLGLANATGLPISTGVTGLGTGVGSFLTTPTFSNLSSAVTGATLFASTTKADVLDAAFFAADAGATDTYVATLSPAITGYVTGSHYRFKANTANTGAASINLNSLGAKTIKKAAGGITTDLADNDIRAGQWVDLVYDGTNMQMQSTLGNAGGSGGGDMLLGTAQTVTAAKTYNAGTLKIASGGDLVDSNGNELFKFTATGSAVNEFTVGNAATGSGPKLSATGGDTDIPINITAKGAGGILLNSNVGLGATPSTYQLHVKQSGQNQLAIETTGGSSYAALRFITTSKTYQFASGSSAGAFYCYDETVGAYRWYLTTNGNFLVGSTSESGLTGAGGFRVGSTTTSTSATTGAEIIDGGLGVAENINAGGNIATQTIGKTLGVKSGSNSKAGTFTLSSGAATLSNSSITANSVLVCWLKTASGAITAAPYATGVSVGTSFTIAGGAGDNSTYNYVILEVN